MITLIPRLAKLKAVSLDLREGALSCIKSRSGLLATKALI